MQRNLLSTESIIWESDVSKFSAGIGPEGSTPPTASGLMPVSTSVNEPCSACTGLEGSGRPIASGLVPVSITVNETYLTAILCSYILFNLLLTYSN